RPFTTCLVPLFLPTDPPTPATSTLSLHDALPISRMRSPPAHPAAWPAAGPPRRLPASSLSSLHCKLPCPVSPAQIRLRSPGSRGDRKSTRLNSSHVSISYAVFCLKQKNTTYSLTL